MSLPFIRLKYVAAINQRALPEDTDPGRPLQYLDISSVGRGELLAEPASVAFAEAPSRARRLVRDGDTIVSTVRTYLRAVLPIRKPHPDTVVSTGFAVVTPRPQVCDRYLAWALQSDTFVEQVVARSVGVSYPAVNAGDLGDICIPLPEPAVQSAIADYLDAETARIDALIDKKMRLKNLLRERLMAHLSSAFDLIRAPTPALSVVVQIAEGQVDPRLEPFASMTLIAPDHVESGTGRLLPAETAAEQGAVSGKYVCEAGDVIYSKIRPALRKVCVAPTRCLTSADMYPLRPVLDLNPAYLCYFLLSDRFSSHAILESERVAMPKINREAFGGIRIPVPSMNEQLTLVKTLDVEKARLERTLELLQSQLRLLAERRQAVITGAVAGELPVPEAAA